MHMDGAFLTALFSDGLFIFQKYKTLETSHVSDTMDNLKSDCRKEAHGREQYQGQTGNQPLRIVNRLHSSPVAYMTG